MSGDNETLKLVLYFILMVIVIYIGIGFVAGFDPRAWLQKLSTTTYEPGSLVQIQELDKNFILDCRSNDYILTLKDLKFDVKPGLSVQGGSLNVMVMLDVRNNLYLGTDTNGNDRTITCGEKDGTFKCDTVTLSFNIRCVGGLGPREVFHFTTWRYNDALRSAILPDQCAYPSLSKILGSYGDFYLSSFNLVDDSVSKSCDRTECQQKDETTCTDTNKCYWGGWPWSKSCQLCPTSTVCSGYDREQCSKCVVARNNGCTPDLLSGCNPP